MENVSVGSNSKKFQTSNFYSLTMIELYESRIMNIIKTKFKPLTNLNLDRN